MNIEVPLPITGTVRLRPGGKLEALILPMAEGRILMESLKSILCPSVPEAYTVQEVRLSQAHERIAGLEIQLAEAQRREEKHLAKHDQNAERILELEEALHTANRRVHEIQEQVVSANQAQAPAALSLIAPETYGLSVIVPEGCELKELKHRKKPGEVHSLISWKLVREKPLLSNEELVAGWVGPHGYRLQQHKTGEKTCACCGKSFEKYHTTAAWSVPAGPFEGNERYYAHPMCLFVEGAKRRVDKNYLPLTSPKLPGLVYSRGTVPDFIKERQEKLDQYLASSKADC